MNLTFTPSELRALVTRIQEESSVDAQKEFIKDTVNKLFRDILNNPDLQGVSFNRVIENLQSEKSRMVELVEEKVKVGLVEKIVQEFLV